MRRLLALVAIVALAGIAAAIALAQATSPTHTVPTVTETTTQTVTETVTVTTGEPARRVLWGARTAPAPQTHGSNTAIAEAQYIEDRIGRKFDVIRTYLQGPSNSWTGNRELRAIVAHGAIPLFSFRSGSFSWAQVANGAADSALRARFSEFLNADSHLWRKAIIGFENEPENEANGEKDEAKGTPADYRAAYDHIVALADSMGLPNKWTTFLQDYTWVVRNPDAWIPDSVDYMGVHAYGQPVHADCTNGAKLWRDLLPALSKMHATAAAHGKRMLIGELGQRDDYLHANPERKANWFRSIPGALEQLPLIDVIAYWHAGSSDSPHGPGGCAYDHSFRIDSTAKALQGFADAGHAAIFND
jgi:hypothetical protein